MTKDRIAELSKQSTQGLDFSPWTMRECLDEIERLQEALVHYKNNPPPHPTMTYADLKNLKWAELMDLLIRTAQICHDIPNHWTMHVPSEIHFTAPVLCQIGDFEIRARFPDHRREELEKREGFSTEAVAMLISGLQHDIQAYRAALGYPVPGDHDGRLSDGTIPQCGRCHSAYHQKLEADYDQLIMAVERAFPGESRHQTALRYIQEAERNATSPESSSADLKP